jgi:acyl-CoA reductase-like NAD-dependent aldehyde dehydrogenase
MMASGAELRGHNEAGQTMTFRLLIDGQLVDGSAGLDVVNPATEQVIASAPRSDAAQLNAAVAAAKAAFPGWAATSWEDRAHTLLVIADAIESHRDELGALITAEQGKPISEGIREVSGAIGTFRAFASMTMPARVFKGAAGEEIYERNSPLGVVAAIGPWNFPLLLLVAKIAPALITGNTLIVKPAPTTPLTVIRFGEIMADLLPPGILNVVVDDNDLGDMLTSHRDVVKVSFTGSTETGRKVMASGASTLKRLTLELGGNDAAIVLEDVDPKAVAKQIFERAMINSGQVCVAIKRVYVPEDIYDDVCAELTERANNAIVGEGMDPQSQYGPVQNRTQFERIKELIADTAEAGTILAGGIPAEGTVGFFVKPTIVGSLPENARLVQEEQFGPVIPVLSYMDLDEAIARANATEFGLGASVWTNDSIRGEEVAARLLAGTVWINRHGDLSPLIPFCGSKMSGIGTDFGEDGLKNYCQSKIVNIGKASIVDNECGSPQVNEEGAVWKK